MKAMSCQTIQPQLTPWQFAILSLAASQNLCQTMIDSPAKEMQHLIQEQAWPQFLVNNTMGVKNQAPPPTHKLWPLPNLYSFMPNGVFLLEGSVIVFLHSLEKKHKSFQHNISHNSSHMLDLSNVFLYSCFNCHLIINTNSVDESL